MLALALTLALPAHADVMADVASEAACAPNVFSELRPSDGQQDVPLDARLLAVIDAGSCGSTTVHWSLIVGGSDSGDGVLVEEGSAFIDTTTHLAPIVPTDLLQADTGYTLVVTHDTGTDAVSFSSGSRMVTPIEDPPTGVLRDLQITTGFQESTTWQAEVDVTYTPSSDGLSIVRVFDPRYPREPIDAALANESGELAWSLDWWGDEATEGCLVFSQEDEAGRETVRSEPVCAVPDEIRTGCSTSGGAPVGWLGLLLAPLAALRRRRVPQVQSPGRST